MIRLLQYSSPAIVVQLALEDVAGSGAVRHERFEEQSDLFHEEYRTFFVEKIKKEQGVVSADLAHIPQMNCTEESFGSLSARVIAGVVFLFLCAFGLLMMAIPGLRKIGRLTR